MNKRAAQLRFALGLLLAVPVWGVVGSVERTYTVANLPAASSMSGGLAWATDGANAHDCVTGGGSSLVHCISNGTIWSAAAPASTAGTDSVSFSATPTFSSLFRASIIVLTGNITSFTLAAGIDGQEKTLTFCQDTTGGRTVAPPANVHGFFVIGATLSKCSSQHYTYFVSQSAWIADTLGVLNQ